MTERIFFLILGVHLMSVLIGYLLVPKNKKSLRTFLILIVSVILLEVILGVAILNGVPAPTNTPMGKGFGERIAMLLVTLIVHVILIIICFVMRILRKDK